MHRFSMAWESILCMRNTMALSKEIPTDLGISANYFHINRLDCYPRDGVFDVGVKGYVSKQARDQGSENIFVFCKRYEYPQGIEDMTQQLAYGLIKLETIFEGATDT